MDSVETMKTLQGWTDTSILHFRDLAIFGEQILLSIRFGAWTDEIHQEDAANWARYWRPEVQGYIYAYRAATGVDLAAATVTGQVNATLPSVLLQPATPAAGDGRTAAGGGRRRAAAGSGRRHRSGGQWRRLAAAGAAQRVTAAGRQGAAAKAGERLGTTATVLIAAPGRDRPHLVALPGAQARQQERARLGAADDRRACRPGSGSGGRHRRTRTGRSHRHRGGDVGPLHAACLLGPLRHHGRPGDPCRCRHLPHCLVGRRACPVRWCGGTPVPPPRPGRAAAGAGRSRTRPEPGGRFRRAPAPHRPRRRVLPRLRAGGTHRELSVHRRTRGRLGGR